MSRALLVLAMVASLWPVAALAVSFTSDTSATSDANSTEVSRTAKTSDLAATQAADDEEDREAEVVATARADLDSLTRQVKQLLDRFEKSPSLRGEPDQGMARAANRLSGALRSWRSSHGASDYAAARFTRIEQRIAERVRGFASEPTQGRLDAFNRAIRAHNREVKSRR